MSAFFFGLGYATAMSLYILQGGIAVSATPNLFKLILMFAIMTLIYFTVTTIMDLTFTQSSTAYLLITLFTLFLMSLMFTARTFN
ncbi:MAG: hypothetical protein DRP42_03500 [Tenericutes bacterium]|nr:MAG: hypothetical protein DRP42_03500 [Mycoplasmatota bacterium]